MNAKLLARFSSRRAMHRLKRVGENQLVLGKTSLVQVAAISFGVLALAMFLLNRTLAGGLVPLFACIAASLWLFPSGAVLDRSRGLLTLRRFLVVRRFPLCEVSAVKIIDGGWHSSRHPAASYRTSELTLILENAAHPSLHLTNHADHALTRSMARQIADFLRVPMVDETQPSPGKQGASETSAARADSQETDGGVERFALHRVCYTLAFVAGLFSVVFGLSQAEMEQLEAAARPVRARLTAAEVKEWIAGHDNWAAIGTFEIESGEFQGRAEGPLNPSSERGTRRRKITRAEAERFLRSWQIGKIYDGYVYSDHPTNIFFELPGARENARLIWWLRGAAVSLFALGFAAFLVRVRRQVPANPGQADGGNDCTS